MKISGPFRDREARKAGRPKTWFLRVVSPRLDASGTPMVGQDGRKLFRRERPYYETQEAAKADIPSLRAQHELGGVSAAGIVTRAVLEDVDAARSLVPAEEASHADLARFWRLHHPAGETKRIAELVTLFLTELEIRNGVTRHLGDLKSRLHQFATRFGQRYPETITREEIMGYLLGMAEPAGADGNTPRAGRTVLNFKRAVCNLFNWLIEKGHVHTANPAGGIKRRQLPRIERKEIQFLSIGEAETYLRACERYDPELVAHEVVQLFAGVRSDDEMGNFRAEWVLPETKEIVIPAEHAKMVGRRDVIDGLEKCFWSWWEAYGRPEGLLRPKNYQQRWYRVRILARLQDVDRGDFADELAILPVKLLLLRQDIGGAIPPWPWNARRRTFCTYHVAKYRNADRTALILRHKGKTSVLHDSYRGLGVSPGLGAAYFALAPEPVKAPIRPILPARGIVRLQSERAADAAGVGAKTA